MSAAQSDWQREWPAPAKLNLFLHVVGRREDGYHCLQTVFRFVDLVDTLHFKPRSDGEIVLATPIPGVPPESDLTVRAACLLQQATGCRQGAVIHLEKRLPMGGGLGGGSSDAATVLLALNHLWQTGLSRSELEQLGLQLGADVPVFVHGRSTFAEGVGECFTDLDLPETSYAILQPAVNVPTGQIFTAPDLCRSTPVMAPADWQSGVGHNDLEPVACRLFPEVRAVLDWLRGHCASAMMTGSGACVFAETASLAAAQSLCAEAPAGVRAWAVSGLTRHPLATLV